MSRMVGGTTVQSSSFPSVYSRFTATEFRRHREVTNPVHVMGFLTQWKMYLDELPHDPTVGNFKKLDRTVFEKVELCMCSAAVTTSFPWHVFLQMSAEQLGQLYELMHASKDVWKPVKESFDLEHGKS